MNPARTIKWQGSHLETFRACKTAGNLHYPGPEYELMHKRTGEIKKIAAYGCMVFGGTCGAHTCRKGHGVSYE